MVNSNKGEDKKEYEKVCKERKKVDGKQIEEIEI